MRFDKVFLTLGLAGVLGWSLAASDGGIKIGIVDIEQAVISTDEGKAAREEFERKNREAEAKLMPLAEKLQEMLKEVEAKKFVLSDEALFQKRLDMAELQNQIQTKQQELKGQLEVDRERLIGPLRAKLGEIIVDIGRKEGFSLILQRGAPGVMYTREALDITDIVIESFNKQG